MKLIRLNHDQYARWRSNRMCLVTSEGEFVRYASETESASAETARRRGTIVRVRDGGRLLDFTTDREVMKRLLVKDHGSCRIQLFNGKTLAQVHDPNVSRLSAVAPKETNVTSPEYCQCAKWGGRQAGKHHPACSYNKIAPPEQRGYPKEDIIEAEEIVLEEAPKADPTDGYVPSPEECACHGWAKPGDSDPNLHHPTCSWFDPWNLRADGEHGLYDADGTYRRPASHAEVKAAKARQEIGESPIITIAGDDYVVLKMEESVMEAADHGISAPAD